MKSRHAPKLILLATALAVCGCSLIGRRGTPAAGTPVKSGGAPAGARTGVPPPPADPLSIPDAVPKAEPRARSGNPPFYDVFGKRYYVMASSGGYIERGVASWYGPGFHAERTSIGEPYDMYGMTAAHKTLSLPTYVRVTNLENSRSVIVRVNDRGPFVGNRIIDLSYTAAAKLDMLRHGTAFVEVRAIDPVADPIAAVAPVTSALLTPPARGAAGGLYIQAGAFTDRSNAERLADRLRRGNYGNVFVRDVTAAGKTFYRVRIGPVADVAAFDRTVKAIENAGVNDARLALE
jgi:rare lipoprotein A